MKNKWANLIFLNLGIDVKIFFKPFGKRKFYRILITKKPINNTIKTVKYSKWGWVIGHRV